jgi:hypothetical protein
MRRKRPGYRHVQVWLPPWAYRLALRAGFPRPASEILADQLARHAADVQGRAARGEPLVRPCVATGTLCAPGRVCPDCGWAG